MSRITLLIGAVFLLALALVVVLVTRPATTSLPHAAPLPPPTAATASPAKHRSYAAVPAIMSSPA